MFIKVDDLESIEREMRCVVWYASFTFSKVNSLEIWTDPAITPCSHIFCRGCIEQSLRNNNKCPLCNNHIIKRGLTNVQPLKNIVTEFYKLRQKIEEYDTSNRNGPPPPVQITVNESVGKTHEELDKLFPHPEKDTDDSDAPTRPDTPRNKRGSRRRRVTSQNRMLNSQMSQEDSQSSQPESHPQTSESTVQQNNKRKLIEFVDEDEIAADSTDEDVETKMAKIQDKIKDKRNKVQQLEQVLQEISENSLNNLSFERFPIMRVVLDEQINNQSRPSPKRRRTMQSDSIASASTAPSPHVTPATNSRSQIFSRSSNIASPPNQTLERRLEFNNSDSRRSSRKKIPSAKVRSNMNDSSNSLISDSYNSQADDRSVIIVDESSRDSASFHHDDEQRTDLVQRQQQQEQQEHTYVICGTVLDKKQQEDLTDLCKNLGARLSSKMTPQVTHVVTPVDHEGLAKRTIKFASGIVCGSWIVGYQWVQECMKRDRFVDEEPFEVKGDNVAKEGPSLGRNARASNKEGIFSHLFIFLYGKFKSPNPSKPELHNLAEWGGATMLKKMPSAKELITNGTTPRKKNATPTKSMENTVIIVENDITAQILQDVKKASGLTPIKFTWLLDSVSRYKLLDRTIYLAKDEKK
jgi:hypothetical protein